MAPNGRKNGSSSMRKIPDDFKSYVKGQITRGKESHFHYVSQALAGTGVTAQVIDLSAITTGTTDNTKIGDKVILRSLSIGFRLDKNTAQNANFARIIIISTRVTGTPTLAQILEDTTVPQVLFTRYADTQHRHRILMDKLINLEGLPHEATTWRQVKFFDFFVRKDLGILHYDDATTTSKKNKIWLIIQGATDTNPMTLAFESLLKFRDM